MDNFHLVVEGEAGPLMLSPSGQFITPSSCPITLLFSFMTANLKEARSRLDRYVADLEYEKNAIDICIKKVQKYVNKFDIQLKINDNFFTFHTVRPFSARQGR